MPSGKTYSLKISLLLAALLAAPVQAVEFKSADQSVSSQYDNPVPESAAPEKSITTAPAEAPTISDDATDVEEREAIRQELEQREATRAEELRLNCKKARAEITRMADLPARNVLKTDESGQIARMTEAEHAAHLEQWRKVETENCK